MSDDNAQNLSIESSEESDVQMSTNTEEVRQRTFSHWPNYPKQFLDELVRAGFYGCNDNDYVICLSCNLIVHEWQPGTDDPCELHRSLSPTCAYVRDKLTDTNGQQPTIHLGQASVTIPNALPNNSGQGIVDAFPDLPYCVVPKRTETFATWNQPNLPPIDRFINAGFFYTGVGTKVTCFRCNGSVDQWKPADDPTAVHVQHFPHCVYIRQFCGEELYQKLVRHNRLRTESCTGEEWLKNVAKRPRPSNVDDLVFDYLLSTSNPERLKELVDERLDCPMTQKLLNSNYPLEFLEKCWHDQLQLKQEDFFSEDDLRTACMILQQYSGNVGDPAKLIVPSVAMREFRKKLVLGTTAPTTAMQPNFETNRSTRPPDDNLVCKICLREEKQVACLPCGHRCLCKSCQPPQGCCPLCYEQVSSRVRIYM